MHFTDKKPVYFFICTFLCIIFTNPVYSEAADTDIKNGENTEYDILLSQEIKEKKLTENQDKNSDDGTNIKNEEIELRKVVIKSQKTGARKKKNIQEISRHTMTADEMKTVPASFGDSLSALTSLPGIMRVGGDIFGPMVIRGADIWCNNYFIDDIPVHDPMHLGGLHSIINTNLMNEIDIYSSAFPAQFGSSTSAVINITTIDKVNEFSGYADLGLLSSNALMKTPILRKKSGGIVIDTPFSGEQGKDLENAGYLITSARYGNFEFAIKLMEAMTGDEIPVTPVFWDYQLKGKYFLTKANSITLLLMGLKDYYKVILDDNDQMEEGDDPYYSDFDYKFKKVSHSQALYWDYGPSRKFNNRVVCYSTFPESTWFMDFGAQGAASWAKDIHTKNQTRIFSIKDKLFYKWLNGLMETRGALEYQMFYFKSSGKTIRPRGEYDPNQFNPGNEDLFDAVPFDVTIRNHLYSGYIENKFVMAGLAVVPGVRSDYLVRTGIATFDPRIMASYKFQSGTTISGACGKYSYFLQTNPFFFDTNAEIAKIDDLEPETATHSSIGIEQVYNLYSLKVEGFYNMFYDKPISFMYTKPDGSEVTGFDDGQGKAYGFEIMLKKDKKENQDGLFGWISYTYTLSKKKSNIPAELDVLLAADIMDGAQDGKIKGDPYGDSWINSPFEQEHVFKIVAGYTFGRHSFSGRFQYFTLTPFTEITGSVQDEYYVQTDDSYPEERYSPVYSEKPNTERLQPFHRLDVRYSYKINNSWGYVSFYVELINAYNNRRNEYKWYWDRPYSPDNPKIKETDDFAMLPNFGVEVKF